ncbi:hypothetical protein ACFVSU_15235 [Microbacterium sp. NPDC058062]|uniref:hypothetical protein n=1 Tax=Microbacterium sp. NPDC058062 TaxID=3346320 RepID=UPI0036DBCBEC
MPRLPSIDVLRVLAVAIIVFRHTYPGPPDGSQPLIITISVAFFFFLTGWLWRPRRRTVAEEAANRWRTLGRPYVSWLLVILSLYALWLHGQGGLDPAMLRGPLLGGMYAGAPFSTFWFVSALFFVAILMRAIERMPLPWLVALGTVLLAIGGIWGHELATVPLALGVALPSLSFAIAGRALRAWMPSHTRRRAMIAAVALPLAVAATFGFTRLDLKYGQFGTLLVSGLLAIIVIWCAIALLDALFSSIDSTVVRGIQPALSRVTTVAIVVVLIHPVLIWIYRMLRPEATAPWWVYVVILIGSWTAALLLERTRLSPWFVGQPRWISRRASARQPVAR